MDVKKRFDAAVEKLKGAKYVLLVLLAGLVLLLLPTGREETAEKEPAEESAAQASPDGDLESRLQEILSLIDGAGRVRVLLTPADDGERVLAKDTESVRESRDGETRSEDTESSVVIQRSGGGSEPVEITCRAPRYRGAVIAAQGADNAKVRLDILEAVKAATGLTGDVITIVKMRS